MLHFVYPLWLFALAGLPLLALVLVQRAYAERKDLERLIQGQSQ